MQRRHFLLSALGACPALRLAIAQTPAAPKILLRSSWQTVNIGDIAHTPGMLALLQTYRPDTEVTLWPNELSREVEQLLLDRFPKLQIARTREDQEKALNACDFFLHGSGPGLVGREAARMAMLAGKPYGFGGVTLNDEELKSQRDLLSRAKFVFCRDSDSLKALKASGITGPILDFGPDATFALDLRDDMAANALLKTHGLQEHRFLCVVPRLRWTPYWEIHPERRKLDPEKDAVNKKFAEEDHAKLREAIIAWVRQLGLPVFLTPEMTYAVSRLRPLLLDPLPDDVKPHVSAIDRYWLTAEAASVYAKAAAVLSMEMHSPIMAIAAGTPAIHVRQPTDTRKGTMWRDIGLGDWLFDVDQSTGSQIAARVLEVGQDPQTARTKVAEARSQAHHRMKAMIAAIG